LFAPFPGLGETAECGIGFQSTDGKYYGLGLDQKHEWLIGAWDPDREELFNITGVLTLGPDSSEYAGRYDMVGIINATSVATVDGRVSIYEVYDRHYNRLQTIADEIKDKAGGGYSFFFHNAPTMPNSATLMAEILDSSAFSILVIDL
jgi:hypothetical protein